MSIVSIYSCLYLFLCFDRVLKEVVLTYIFREFYLKLLFLIKFIPLFFRYVFKIKIYLFMVSKLPSSLRSLERDTTTIIWELYVFGLTRKKAKRGWLLLLKWRLNFYRKQKKWVKIWSYLPIVWFFFNSKLLTLLILSDVPEGTRDSPNHKPIRASFMFDVD